MSTILFRIRIEVECVITANFSSTMTSSRITPFLSVSLWLQVSVSESRRPEEESAFWKISAERSRLEGEQADFQSLTPSQIKSLEKGEKPLPSYLRQVHTHTHTFAATV